MAGPQVLLLQEAAEAPTVVERQLSANAQAMAVLGERLRRHPPPFVVTSARGSSDHAATFAKYLFETRLGLATASLAPSVATIYGKRLRLADALFVTISQSGRSPDLIRQAEAARAAGAYTVALVNVADSPLAKCCDVFLPLHAGPEKSVAATKSYIASLSALAHLVAAWSADRELHQALRQLAGRLDAARRLDWSVAKETFAGATSLLTLGRGLGLAVAAEAALKLKEVCGIHAEAYSAAEVMHGPVTLVRPGFPLLVFGQPDDTRHQLGEAIADLVAKGATVFAATHDRTAAAPLPVAQPLHPALDLLPMLQSFYGLLVDVARARDRDPDHPRHLQKVTRTT